MSYNSFYASKAEIIDESEARKYIKSGSNSSLSNMDWYRSFGKKPIKDWYNESIQETQLSSWARLHRLGSAN
jgi:hypothetical protein